MSGYKFPFLALISSVLCLGWNTATAQTNPYQLVDAPAPPVHLNAGRWGEMIQVRVDTDDNVYVYHRCFKAVLGDPNVAPGHSDGLTANCLGRWSGYPPLLKFFSGGRISGCVRHWTDRAPSWVQPRP